MGTGLASFVVSGFVLWRMPLRKIMGFCALLQRMGILGGFGANESLCFRLLLLRLTRPHLEIEMWAPAKFLAEPCLIRSYLIV